MERFNAEVFYKISTVLRDLQSIKVKPGEDLTSTRESLNVIESCCVLLGFQASSISARRLAAAISHPPEDPQQISALAGELRSRIQDEMAARIFLSLSPWEAKLYAQPREEWGVILERFPSVARDAEEAGRCLALGRNTASVFHAMRIAECGLRALGKALGDPNLDPKTNPTWERILARSEKELQKPHKDRSPEWSADEGFFSTATANLRAVKDAWRNPALHVEKHYDGEEAREISSAVRAFMRHLATKLAE